MFKAASSCESAAYNPGSYWLLSPDMAFYQRGLLGGSYFENPTLLYGRFAPSLNARHVHTPLLMEYNSESLFGLEFYWALKERGVPVELIFYPESGHVFQKPKQRVSSMQRNLDWFRFWLNGEEEDDPAKAEQYARWRELRKLQEKNEATRTGSKQ